LDFAESDEDLLDSEADLPDGLLDPDGDFSSTQGDEAAEWGGVSINPIQKRKSTQESKDSVGTGDIDSKDGRKKRRKLKHLPTFASLEDYEQLIDQAPEENI